MGAGGTRGGNGVDDLMCGRKASIGVDRGFIFFDNGEGRAWRGITNVKDDEGESRIEVCYIDGKKISQRHIAGDYSATVASYDDPFGDEDLREREFGISYREHYVLDGEEFYRLHLIHGVSIVWNGMSYSTINDSSTPDTHSWSLVTTDVQLSDNIRGSHLILDSGEIYEWILRDIEDILYGWKPDTSPRIPTIEEMYEIFSLMNLVIIDHGDGTWSAVGHASMIEMLDPNTFAITTPSAEMVDADTYTIESLVRNEQWLE